MFPTSAFFLTLGIAQGSQHHRSRGSGCVYSQNLGSDDLGLPPEPTDQRPKPKSLVRLLPASAICPMDGLRHGRLRPDQIVPKRANLKLSRFSLRFHRWRNR